MGKTKISYAEHSENPIRARDKVTGRIGHYCTKKSPGCVNCYSEGWNLRFGNGLTYTPDNAKRVEFFWDEKTADKIRKRRIPTRYFLFDMTDLFHPMVPLVMAAHAFHLMEHCPQHTFMILTKRPELALMMNHACGIPELSNVWLGVTAENQKCADERIPMLLELPAAKRFVSVEPMLTPVDMESGGWLFPVMGYPEGKTLSQIVRPRLDLIICGAESGPNRRAFDVAWAEDLYDQCHVANVLFYGKQDSELRPGTPLLIHGREIKELPNDNPRLPY